MAITVNSAVNGPGQGFDPNTATALQTAVVNGALSTVNVRRSGNTTTGVGADLVFVSAAGAGVGKLNTGVDLLIPANTLIAGNSVIRLRFAVRRTGTDISFLILRFGPTNGTADSSTGIAIQFAAGTNPQDYTFDVLISATTAQLTFLGTINPVGVGGAYGSTTELTGLNFAVNNYLTFTISNATTGNYRCVAYDMTVFP